MFKDNRWALTDALGAEFVQEIKTLAASLGRSTSTTKLVQ